MFLTPTDKDFDALADKASQDFMAGKGSLKDILAEQSRGLGLNPLEIRRLTERTNSSAMVKLLELSKDKKVEFDIADPQEVIERVHDSESDEESPEEEADIRKVAGFYSLPDLRTQDSAKSVTFMEKSAATDPQTEPAAKNTLPAYFKSAKQVQELRQQKMACELKFHDHVDYLLTEFNQLYPPDFHKFASDISTIHGNFATPLLTALGASLHEDLSEMEKTAGVIDDRPARYTKVAECLGYLKTIMGLEQKLVTAQDNTQQIFSGLKSNGHN